MATYKFLYRGLSELPPEYSSAFRPRVLTPNIKQQVQQFIASGHESLVVRSPRHNTSSIRSRIRRSLSRDRSKDSQHSSPGKHGSHRSEHQHSRSGHGHEQSIRRPYRRERGPLVNVLFEPLPDNARPFSTVYPPHVCGSTEAVHSFSPGAADAALPAFLSDHLPTHSHFHCTTNDFTSSTSDQYLNRTPPSQVQSRSTVHLSLDTNSPSIASPYPHRSRAPYIYNPPAFNPLFDDHISPHQLAPQRSQPRRWSKPEKPLYPPPRFSPVSRPPRLHRLPRRRTIPPYLVPQDHPAFGYSIPPRKAPTHRPRPTCEIVVDIRVPVIEKDEVTNKDDDTRSILLTRSNRSIRSILSLRSVKSVKSELSMKLGRAVRFANDGEPSHAKERETVKEKRQNEDRLAPDYQYNEYLTTKMVAKLAYNAWKSAFASSHAVEVPVVAITVSISHEAFRPSSQSPDPSQAPDSPKASISPQPSRTPRNDQKCPPPPQYLHVLIPPKCDCGETKRQRQRRLQREALELEDETMIHLVQKQLEGMMRAQGKRGGLKGHGMRVNCGEHSEARKWKNRVRTLFGLQRKGVRPSYYF